MNYFFEGVTHFIHNPLEYLKNIPQTLSSIRLTCKMTYKSRKLLKELLSVKDKLIYDNPELKEYLDIIAERQALTTFNARFEDFYIDKEIDVRVDNESGLKYVEHKNRKLFYPKNYTDEWIIANYRSLLVEQSENSPHRYLNSDDDIDNTIFFDCGSAEGILALEFVERAKKIYLFEADSKWNMPLINTFTENDKVTIVNSFVGDGNDGTLSLREYIEGLLSSSIISVTDKLFVKIDIEGYEEVVIKDLLPIFNMFEKITVAVCVYHTTEAESNIRKMIDSSYRLDVRDGYMLFIPDKGEVEYPYFRHGVLRIDKEK